MCQIILIAFTTELGQTMLDDNILHTLLTLATKLLIIDDIQLSIRQKVPSDRLLPPLENRQWSLYHKNRLLR